MDIVKIYGSALESATMPLQHSSSELFVKKLLQEANIRVGGDQPQDIHVHDPAFYARVLTEGSLGLGESYMDGQWDANQLDVCIERVIRANLERHVKWNRHTVCALLQAIFTNMQSKHRSKQVAEKHYDESGVLPEALLDPYNQYTCAYFDETDDLNEAQQKKLDLICRKLQLKDTDRVLDIGCGWGGFAKFAAEHYGCHVTGISISNEQIKYAQEFCQGLPVDIQYCDYRDLDGKYDKVLTCGMVEHVGPKNYRRLLQTICDHLSDDGLYLLHTIGSNTSLSAGDPFFHKYIFPNGILPSLEQIDRARDGLLTLHDVQNLGAHYDPTLMAWNENFKRNWPSIANLYDERFRRMYEYYLLSNAGGFRAGSMQLWQMVFSKVGHVMDYRGPR